MRGGRVVRGFHGTTRSSAERLLQAGELPKLSDRAGNWLGRGFYFFEENLEMALEWSLLQVNVRARMGWFDSPAVLSADIELSHCLDLCTGNWQQNLREAAKKLSQAGVLPEQAGPELETEGFHANPAKTFKIEDYPVSLKSGADPLDHFADKLVIEAVVEDLIRKGRQVDCVRAAFVAGCQPYANSHFFSDTHIQIAVLEPARALADLRLLTV